MKRCPVCTTPTYHPQDQPTLRWVPCEACGGSGEIIHRNPLADSAYQEPDEYAELCGACEGTGRDCVETHEIEMEDLRYGKLPPA